MVNRIVCPTWPVLKEQWIRRSESTVLTMDLHHRCIWSGYNTRVTIVSGKCKKIWTKIIQRKSNRSQLTAMRRENDCSEWLREFIGGAGPVLQLNSGSPPTSSPTTLTEFWWNTLPRHAGWKVHTKLSGARMYFNGVLTIKISTRLWTAIEPLRGTSRTLSNTGSCFNVVLVLGQRRRRWPNTKPTLGQLLVFAGTVRPLYLRTNHWTIASC